jgi:hypothetical protein
LIHAWIKTHAHFNPRILPENSRSL